MNKTVRRTVGLMSGTSADGLDVAICEVDIERHSLRNLHSQTFPYSDILRSRLLEIARLGHADLHELILLSNHLGQFYARCIEEACITEGIPLTSIDLVGSHGQTVAHLSQPEELFGKLYRGTLQIGEAEVLAKTLGTATVSDFRPADVAVAGSGAPLVPIYHQSRFAKPNSLLVIVNIGGIANITVLDGDSRIYGTDTGPGNCLIDSCVRLFFDKPYDDKGQIALSGKVDCELLSALSTDELFARALPLSYDRKEMLELGNRHHLYGAAGKLGKESVIATVTHLTVATIGKAISTIVDRCAPDKLLVCGGGVYNEYIMSALRKTVGNNSVSSTAEYGSNPEFVEAEAFAYLANLALNGETGNVPAATGASRKAVLGKISQP